MSTRVQIPVSAPRKNGADLSRLRFFISSREIVLRRNSPFALFPDRVKSELKEYFNHWLYNLMLTDSILETVTAIE